MVTFWHGHAHTYGSRVRSLPHAYPFTLFTEERAEHLPRAPHSCQTVRDRRVMGGGCAHPMDLSPFPAPAAAPHPRSLFPSF